LPENCQVHGHNTAMVSDRITALAPLVMWRMFQAWLAKGGLFMPRRTVAEGVGKRAEMAA
jgi:hypothetical protein